jgi:SAM-dependent methyltransferase
VLAGRSVVATVIAIAMRAPGQRYGIAGRALGIRALLAGRRAVGRDLILTPVNIVRYWEFPFVQRHVPAGATRCLDVGSPRLFTIDLARRRPGARIRVINPDRADVAATRTLAAVAGLSNVEIEPLAVADLAGDPARYDAIWSISVLEHIPADGDREAIAVLYAALAPGGRLLVTVPVDRHAWDEHRRVDTYRLGLPLQPEGYFFQHWYDEAAIRNRLLSAVGDAAAGIGLEWFGEAQPGRFAAYEQAWMREGHARTVSDPIEIARGYRTYARWADMPGQGVCGLAISKPA